MTRSANTATSPTLPAGVVLFERGWLSSNNILIVTPHSCTLIDSGYATHAEQTMLLVDSVVGDRPLQRLINTHLHSDHCGGNAALQARYPAMETWIPPGQSEDVALWNQDALSYQVTGQQCPRFGFSKLLMPGSDIEIGEKHWQVHAAPGHDPDAVLLFEPEDRLLISADALWNNGFGVVFPEIDGIDAFDSVQETLDLIERLDAALVIPGHGPAFTDVGPALERARRRLAQFRREPAQHSRYAAKALLKFKLLEMQSMPLHELEDWMLATKVMQHIHERHPNGLNYKNWASGVVHDLVASGAARVQNGALYNS